MSPKQIIQGLCPPLFWTGLRRTRRMLRKVQTVRTAHNGPSGQDLDVYWTPAIAAVLETWADGNAWDEIQLLLCLKRGPVLDIACGTGKAMTLNMRFRDLELHGCDISDFLIGKAKRRGIPEERLRVCDATSTGYADEAFEYSYSIGSLEHFTEPGIEKFLHEASRVTRLGSFHHIPTARDGRDHGWITPQQSYFNNSIDWWRPKFETVFSVVHVLDSTWGDEESVGTWFVCSKG